MKKILFVALAAVGLTACVQNEELAISKSNAITFDNVYVQRRVTSTISMFGLPFRTRMVQLTSSRTRL